MVNIRTSKKRKSNYNRTRLSRRVKRGGGLFERLTGLFASTKTEEDLYAKPITNDEDYSAVLTKINEDYPFISTKSIANGAIITEEYNTLSPIQQQAISANIKLPTILIQIKAYQIQEYKKLLEKSKPEYPYARILTPEEKRNVKIMKEAAQKKAKLHEEEMYRQHKRRNPNFGPSYPEDYRN